MWPGRDLVSSASAPAPAYLARNAGSVITAGWWEEGRGGGLEGLSLFWFAWA